MASPGWQGPLNGLPGSNGPAVAASAARFACSTGLRGNRDEGVGRLNRGQVAHRRCYGLKFDESIPRRRRGVVKHRCSPCALSTTEKAVWARGRPWTDNPEPLSKQARSLADRRTCAGERITLNQDSDIFYSAGVGHRIGLTGYWDRILLPHGLLSPYVPPPLTHRSAGRALVLPINLSGVWKCAIER